MIVGGFVVVCMIIGEHQKNAGFFDRWRMQKIDDATVKKRANSFRTVLAAYFWEELLLSQSTTSSSPSPWRSNWFRNCCIVSLYKFSILFNIYVWYILLHSTLVHQPKILPQGSQDRCCSESKTGKWLPPSVTVVLLTFTFTLLCQWCCQCCLRALPRSRSTSAGHQHASRSYSRHF